MFKTLATAASCSPDRKHVYLAGSQPSLIPAGGVAPSWPYCTTSHWLVCKGMLPHMIDPGYDGSVQAFPAPPAAAPHFGASPVAEAAPAWATVYGFFHVCPPSADTIMVASCMEVVPLEICRSTGR